jgi:hypothetical protein
LKGWGPIGGVNLGRRGWSQRRFGAALIVPGVLRAWVIADPSVNAAAAAAGRGWLAPPVARCACTRVWPAARVGVGVLADLGIDGPFM